MDITKIVNELRAEREAIDAAIMTLQRLGQGRGKRRGRPPAWLAQMRDFRVVEPPPDSKRDREVALQTA